MNKENWDKFNAEFDALLDSMTVEKWNEWKQRCEKRLLEKQLRLKQEEVESLLKLLDEQRT